MKYVKMLGLLVVAAAALMAFAGTASASTLTSPAGTTYTGEIVATSTNSKLDGAFVTVECSHSESKGSVEQHGEANAGGKVSALTFTGCNYTTTVKNKGSLEITSANSVISKGAEVEIATSVGTCIFTTNATTGTTVGTLTESNETAHEKEGKKVDTPAVLDINSAKIPRTGGNFLCGSSGTWTGNYTVTTPSLLYVD